MKKVMPVIFIVLIAVYLAFSWFKSRPLYSESLDQDIANLTLIAPIDKAITLAKTINNEVLLVVSSDKDGVYAINLNSALSLDLIDSVKAYKQLGTERLQQIASENTTQKYVWEDLGVPVQRNNWNIGVGSNYLPKESEKKPFLFPKFSSPVQWNSPVADGNRLDHEVELCMLPIEEKGDKMGLVLCNDYTDVWTLLKNIDLGSKMGLTGVADAKAGEGRLTIGPLLVIPNADDFYKEIEIGLYLNGELRQRSFVSSMTWKPEKILEESRLQCDEPYIYKGEASSLYSSCGNLLSSVLIMTGTPGGTMFSPLTVLNPWSYLREGDVVKSYATYLGMTESLIVKEM